MYSNSSATCAGWTIRNKKGRKSMKIPAFIKPGETVAVAATSDGVTHEFDVLRFVNAKQTFENNGYNFVFGDQIFGADSKGRSCPGALRGEIFNGLIANPDIRWIIAAKGGNFLNEMLPHIDFERLEREPKWFQGYSDNTSLVHTLTTKYDIVSIYGSHCGDFGMMQWHESIENNFAIVKGELPVQNSFPYYQEETEDGFTVKVTGYDLNRQTCWKSWKEEVESVAMEGRLLGGCLDVLVFLHGTPYDHTLEFIEKYKEDGIIWYLETFDMSGEMLMMFLWQLKECGWFKHTKGIMFGRPLFYKDYTHTPYEEAALYALGDLGVPVLFDCDFGHKAPRFSMVNGAYAKVEYNNGKAKLSYDFTKTVRV